MEQETEKYLANYLLQRFISNPEIHFDAKNRVLYNGKVKIIIQSIINRKISYISVLKNEIPCYRKDEGEIQLEKFPETENDWKINWDIIGEIYDHLTLREERKRLSVHEENQILLPILDMKIYYFYILLKPVFNWNYKKFKEKSFVICLTHDVDRTGDSRLYRFITYFYQALKQRRPKLLLHAFIGRNYDANFDEIISRELEIHAKATWFVLTRYGLRKNADYSTADSNYLRGLKVILEANHEIGLHTPYMDLTVEDLIKEKEKLPIDDKKSIGVRMHHLRGEYPELTEILADSGFRFDSTFGYNFIMGYRFGTSFPFKPIKTSENEEKIIDIYEIPLNIMDIQITSEEEFANKIKFLFKILKEIHGICIINWHNNRFNEVKYGNKWKNTFNVILNQGEVYNAWFCSIGELLNYVESEII